MSNEFDEYGYGEQVLESPENFRFFRCPEGGVIHVDQIGGMRRVGFTIIGVTAVGEQNIAHFDSIYEAEAFLDWVSAKVPTGPTEKAKEMCKKVLYDYLISRYTPIASSDLAPIDFDDIWVEACKPNFSHSMTEEMLHELVKSGHIIKYSHGLSSHGEYCMPDRPTRVAVQDIVNRMYSQFHTNGTYDYEVILKGICGNQFVRLDYPSDWGRVFIEALISIGWAECVDSPNGDRVNVKGAPEEGATQPCLFDDYRYLYNTKRIEEELDQMTWRALPEPKEIDSI